MFVKQEAEKHPTRLMSSRLAQLRNGPICTGPSASGAPCNARSVPVPDHPTLAGPTPRPAPALLASDAERRQASIMLEEIGLPYEVHLVDFNKDDQKTPEFLSLNPNGKIPAIIDPDGPGG